MSVSFFCTHDLAFSRFLPSIVFPSISARSITCLFLLSRMVNRLDFASPCFSANLVLLTLPCVLTNSLNSWIILCLKSRTFFLFDLLIFTNANNVENQELKICPCLVDRLNTNVAFPYIRSRDDWLQWSKFCHFLYQKTMFIKLRWFI